MKTKQIHIWMMGVALLSGCKKEEPVPPPEVKMNAEQRQKYELHVKLQNKPRSSIDGARGVIYYEIKNRDCVPIDYTRSLGGSRPMFQKKYQVEFKENDKNEYVSQLYLDKIKNENYYGIDVCEWGLSSETIYIKMDGVEYPTGMVGSDIAEELMIEEYCFRTSSYDGCWRITAMKSDFFEKNKSKSFKVAVYSKKIY